MVLVCFSYPGSGRRCQNKFNSCSFFLFIASTWLYLSWARNYTLAECGPLIGQGVTTGWFMRATPCSALNILLLVVYLNKKRRHCFRYIRFRVACFSKSNETYLPNPFIVLMNRSTKPQQRFCEVHKEHGSQTSAVVEQQGVDIRYQHGNVWRQGTSRLMTPPMSRRNLIVMENDPIRVESRQQEQKIWESAISGELLGEKKTPERERGMKQTYRLRAKPRGASSQPSSKRTAHAHGCVTFIMTVVKLVQYDLAVRMASD